MAPSDNIVRAFESLAGPLDAEIQALDEQAETLASLRNALLPKLLSGELRIDDPERFLEEAALT
jgi:type I restriction enzyme S subunit